MTILVTGGTGYIGSHTVVELLSGGHEVIVVDNLSNSKIEVLDKIKEITGKTPAFYEIDLRDGKTMRKPFKQYDIDAVIHFAGLKSVPESVAKPIEYYSNNLSGTLELLKVMDEFNVRSMVFSSSAAVYGQASSVPIPETARLHPTNPYGQTKAIIEQMLTDVVNTINPPDVVWRIYSLRYFNPVGAHESGLIGEDPHGTPANLVPYVAQVASGKLPKVKVTGTDYDTPDGTGIRDYIHVVDLAKGHLAALSNLRPGHRVYNLGTGMGSSVFEVIKAFESVTGQKIPYEVTDRRPGDIAQSYADVSKTEIDLGWKAEKTLDDACRDAWRWQMKNQ